MDDPAWPEKTGIIVCCIVSAYFAGQIVKALLVY